MTKSTTIEKSLGALIEQVPGLIRAGNYAEAAHFGALHGANYLAAVMRGGKSNDDATFMPELYLYTGKRKLKLSAVAAVQTGDGGGKDLVQAINAVLKSAKKPTVVLAVVPVFLTTKVKGQRGTRRISGAVGSVFTEPGDAKAGASFAVGTAKELRRAGCVVPNGNKGVQVALVAA